MRDVDTKHDKDRYSKIRNVMVELTKLSKDIKPAITTITVSNSATVFKFAHDKLLSLIYNSQV